MRKATNPNQTCSSCGATFCCDNLAGKSDCWCFNLPPLRESQLKKNAGCLCPACLTKLASEKVTD